jgi:hypothetical protein
MGADRKPNHAQTDAIDPTETSDHTKVLGVRLSNLKYLGCRCGGQLNWELKNKRRNTTSAVSLANQPGDTFHRNLTRLLIWPAPDAKPVKIVNVFRGAQ